MQVIYDILKASAEKYPNNTALAISDYNMSYRTMDSVVCNMSEKLQGYIHDKDRVAIIMDNSIEFVEAFFVINHCKGVVIPIYVNTGIDKICSIVKEYNVKYVMTTKNLSDYLIKNLADHHNELEGIITIEKDMFEIHSTDYKEHCVGNDGLDDDLALILLSSGTTNIPKGIMLTNYD